MQLIAFVLRIISKAKKGNKAIGTLSKNLFLIY